MTELQAAFALNEPIVNETHRLRDLLDKGKHVVIEETTIYCPRTDGLVGTELRIRSVHDDREAADAACAVLAPDDDEYDADHGFGVRSPQPIMPPAQTCVYDPNDDSTIPF